MNSYLSGSLVNCDVHFYDKVTRQAVDPEVVEFAYRIGSNPAIAPVTYDGETTPTVGVIARLGVGWYRYIFDSTSLGDVTIYEQWTGLETNQAPGDGCFYINARNF